MESFDYYDGHTSGLLECKSCKKKYYFWMIAWDKLQDYRLFGLKKVNYKSSPIQKTTLNCKKTKPFYYIYSKDLTKRIDKVLLPCMEAK